MTIRDKRVVGVVGGVIALVLVGTYIHDCRKRQKRGLDVAHAAELDRLWAVCEGTGVAEASARTARVPRPTMLFTEIEPGSHTSWESDARWVPERVDKTQQVACFHATFQLVEMCHYEGGGHSRGALRIRRTLSGSLRDARTAEVIAERAFIATEPPPCPDRLTGVSYEGHAIVSQPKLYSPEPRDEMIAFVREHIDNL